MSKKANKYVDGSKLTLQEWLKVLLSVNYTKVTPYVHFPTDKMLDNYLNTITKIPEEEVRLLLSRFLFPSLTTEVDKINRQLFLQTSKDNRSGPSGKDLLPISEVEKTAYYQRLIDSLFRETFVWEGITWILDLLPDKPLQALETLDSYFQANMQFLPDLLVHAISDASILIRAKYINYEQPKNLFFDLTYQDFEILIAALYESMGYTTRMTKRSHDGGIDIYAKRKNSGRSENLLIQCKRHKKNLGVKAVDEVLGMLTRNKASKGVLINSSNFSVYAKNREVENPRIELVNGKELSILLNNYFGPFWPSKVNRIINSYKRNMISNVK